MKTFCVISGGPGTGKTFTVAKILALLLEQPGAEKIRIALSAPTGKAAARLQEAIKNSKEKLNCREEIKKLIPEEASTIHRLLGSVPDSPYFRHNAENPLAAEAVRHPAAGNFKQPITEDEGAEYHAHLERRQAAQRFFPWGRFRRGVWRGGKAKTTP